MRHYMVGLDPQSTDTAVGAVVVTMGRRSHVRCVGRVARFAFLCALLLAPALAAGDEALGNAEAVIPPGREQLLGEMLGRGAALPDQCGFAGAQVERSVIRSTYKCPDGDVVFELRHPSTAPAGATLTARFAIIVLSGSPPPDLAGALASRIRSREEAFEWTWTSPTTPPRPSPTIVLLAAAAGLLAIVACGWVLQRLVRRRKLATGSSLYSGATAVAAVTAGTGLLCATVHGTLWATGKLFAALLRGEFAAQALVRGGLVVALVAASMIAAALVARFASLRPLRAWVGVLAVTYLVVGYRLSLLPDDLHYFGSLSTYAPHTSWSEFHPGREGIIYRSNAFGFSEPEFDERKPDGVIRVALIGDSYVFGVGVNSEGTLRSHLVAELSRRWPAQRFEVLNLGMPGNNLASHVDLFSIATARLDPDAVVLCLTLPNDLSRWDEQVARQDARHVGLFSFVRFLSGEAAPSLWASMFLDSAVTPAGLQHLDRQMLRLEEIRRRSPNPRVLVLFGFSTWDPAVAGRLKRMPGVAVVPDGTTLPEEFIPGDGHPTAIGNSRSATRIADTLAADPSWRGLLQDGPSS